MVAGDNGFSPNGSVNGEQLNQDRLLLTRGRLPDPGRANEFIADTQTVDQFGWHLGPTVTFAYYTNQASVAAADTGPKIEGHFKVRLVGIGATQVGNLVQDQVDNLNREIVLITPALTRHYLSCCANDTIIGIQLRGGNHYDNRVIREYQQLFPKIGDPPGTEASIENRVARSITPEALALGVFGLITALAALAIASHLIARIIRRASNDSRILRAMGADPKTTMLEGLTGTGLAVLAGSLLAVGLAVAVSPLAPIGPIRPYLGAHVSVDWLVLGVGFAFFTTALGVVAFVLAYRAQPSRPRGAAKRLRSSGLGPTRWAANAGLPVAAVTGVGFALETGGGRRAVPMRSAILGAAIALIIVGATTTFAASLRNLVSSPPLYGWNWSAALNGGGGVGDVPKAIFAPLAKDHDVVATSNAYFATLKIDGVSVPVMGENPGATIQPPTLSGHGLGGRRSSRPRRVDVDDAAQIHRRYRRRHGSGNETHDAPDRRH